MVTIIKQDYTENKKIYNHIEEDLRKDIDKNIPIR